MKRAARERTTSKMTGDIVANWAWITIDGEKNCWLDYSWYVVNIQSLTKNVRGNPAASPIHSYTLRRKASTRGPQIEVHKGSHSVNPHAVGTRGCQ